jgi:hypothetical protein
MGLSPSARELPITLELPASLQREIGKVVTRHAVLELKLSRIVYTLLGIDAVSGRISVREPRTTDRLDMIADLLKINKIKVHPNLNIRHRRSRRPHRRRIASIMVIALAPPKTAGKNRSSRANARPKPGPASRESAISSRRPGAIHCF